MFSGIIEAKAKILKIEPQDPESFEGSNESLMASLRLWVQTPNSFTDLKLGDSIAVDGICLTLEALDQGMLFFVSPETLRMSAWSENQKDFANHEVNLERSLRWGDRMHGHMVLGHVDSKATLLNRSEHGESIELEFSTPTKSKAYIWHKGSIAINGVSLTVNQVTAKSFKVWLIPETLERTNLEALRPGDEVNIETDYLARGMVERLKESLLALAESGQIEIKGDALESQDEL